jgi:integrase
MASIYRHGRGWRAQVYVRGVRDSDTFRTRQEAAQWALQREAELAGTTLAPRTLDAALARYRDDVSPSHKGYRWEVMRIEAMRRHAIAGRMLGSLTGPDIAGWRDERLKQVSPATVAREMTLLRAVLEACRVDWGWIRENPMREVRKPRTPASRKRRITPEEIDRVLIACDLADGLSARTSLQRVGLAFLFALETAMRAGEIVGMRWPDVAEKSVTLPRTKNGDVRVVPLSKRAREILATLPRTDGPVFGLRPGTRDALWRQAVRAAQSATVQVTGRPWACAPETAALFSALASCSASRSANCALIMPVLT